MARKKGSKNIQTVLFEEILAAEKFNPVEEIIYVYREALKAYKADRGNNGVSNNNHQYLTLAGKMAEGFLPYKYPKRKPVDKDNNAGETLTDILKAITNSK